ncbi:MAG TPA: TVP38/TMEM64 family protein [Candidatus Egerieimonas intestinavium]|uniref:TVP38/TMEM64 family membrane protein n=1 Tax=Candidatus Egerieimonas intestinavium TaxID=2840777 RepID=A0A9D1EJK1_9FIRM|nr:TVP38/TMEM64 family protein [Candidatus Egerieimonas intestinavium]
METTQRNYIAILSTSLTILTIIACAVFALYGWQQGIFESRETLTAFIGQAGIWGPAFFIFIQALQVVIPVLPGFITCIVGAVVFGPLPGFLYSYAGMCIGSILAFLFARRYGTGLVKKLISEKNYEKYILWLEKGNKFDLFFAAAIFLPAAPDDVLCFIAGLTRMTWQKFTAIILLGKPFVIALYCLAVAGVIRIPGVL